MGYGDRKERERAWPVAVRAFRRPAVSGSQHAITASCSSSYSPNGRVYVCECVVCVRESERERNARVLHDILIFNFSDL